MVKVTIGVGSAGGAPRGAGTLGLPALAGCAPLGRAAPSPADAVVRIPPTPALLTAPAASAAPAASTLRLLATADGAAADAALAVPNPFAFARVFAAFFDTAAATEDFAVPGFAASFDPAALAVFTVRAVLAGLAVLAAGAVPPPFPTEARRARPLFFFFDAAIPQTCGHPTVRRAAMSTETA
jgi:hypothetical protein